MFRHETWSDDRRKVLSALENGDFNRDRFERFADCGAQSIVFRDPANPERFKVGCNRCHDRFCLPCSQDRARLIAANLAEQRPPGTIRFLTLTLKHCDAPLAEQLSRLYECFAKLRRRAVWKKCVAGGAAFTEVKMARETDRWHPHVHVMMTGKYLPQKAIRDAWHEITGDSFVVDIRLARDEATVTRYLAKYVTKGWSPRVFHLRDKLVEILHAMAGRKLVITFGTWSKLRLLEPPPDGEWEPIATLQELIDRSRQGDTYARSVLTAIHADWWVPPLEPCEIRDG